MSIDNESGSKLEVVKENVFGEGLKNDDEELRRVQSWQKQITLCGVVVSVVIRSIFSVITMKLNLTTGITLNLNVSATLLAFLFMRTWSKLVLKIGLDSAPFTKQENTMIQTCVVACYNIAVGGGLSVVGNYPDSIKEPGIGWMTAFLFLACFISLFMLIPLRKYSDEEAKKKARLARFVTDSAEEDKKKAILVFAKTHKRKPGRVYKSNPDVMQFKIDTSVTILEKFVQQFPVTQEVMVLL
ncbi:hypothetical protein OROHE_000275 [Orobanche hederae]